MNTKWVGIVLLIMAVGIFAAGLWYLNAGETNAEVIARYRPRCEQMRERLRRIAAKCDGPAPGATRKSLNLSPKPIYDNQSRDYNVEILAYEQLLDPDVDLRAQKKFDPGLSTLFLTCLRWAGPKNPMGSHVLRQSAGPLCTPENYEEILSYPYLVVLRATHHEPIKMVTEKVFRGGRIRLQGYFVDLRSEEILGSFEMSAKADDRVMVTHRSDQDREAESISFASSTLWSNAREQIAQKLHELTGGTFVLSHAP